MRLAAWSGNIVLGDITLIEDSAIWKETAANGNTVSFNGTVSGDYTLTVKALDATSFNGTVDLSGLKTTGATTASFGSKAVATIDALTTQAATSLTAEDGASVTFVNVTLKNNSRLTVTGDMEVTEQILSNSTGAGLTVNAESTLTAKKVKNSWGIDMQVDGLLEIGEGGLQMTSSHADTVKGSGIISTSVLGVGNTGTYTFEGGIRLEIGAGGIRQTTENSYYANETTILKDVTIAATESWTNDVTKDLKLASESGTTFEIADTKTVAISGTLSDYSVTSADEDTATVYKGKLVKDGEGTLTLKGSNTYTGGTEVKAGKLVAATGAALGKAGTTTISGGSLEIQAAKATITKSAANTNATITYISGAEGSTGDVYSIDNSGYQVENAKVELVADNATTISNRLIGVELVNNGTGEITAGNGYNDFTSINAASGNITLKGLAAEAGTGNVDTVDNLSIGENRTLSVYSNWTGTLTEATVKVTGSANFASGAIMNGNLVLGNGATVTMADALTMGSTLTLGTGMELDGALLTSVTGLTEGNTVDLFTGVDGLTLGSTSYDADTSLELGTETLSSYFGNVTNPDIYLGYNADTNVVYAGVMQTPVTPAVPEPTTATLSLLALAALASRRRRK